MTVEAQTLQHVGDDTDAAGARGCLDLLQAPTDGDDEVKATEPNERFRSPSFSVVGYPKPDKGA